MKNLNFYPYNHDAVVLRSGLNVVLQHPSAGHLCGYTAFRSVFLPRAWRGDYNADGLQYLSVHGGLTYARQEGPWSVFGFDCAHAGDDGRPELQDPEYVMRLTVQMRQQIIAHRNLISKWRKANRKARADLMDRINAQANIKTEWGFGAMIGMLSGLKEFGE